MTRSWRVVVSLVIPITGLTQPAPDSMQAVREEFAAAYELARSGSPTAGPESPALRDYVLYPYLEAATLGSNLDTVDDWSRHDVAMQAFLAAHGNEPVTFNARVVWLQRLAERALWEAFLDNYRDSVAGPSLRCQYLAARIAVGDHDGIERLIGDVWLTPSQLPVECEHVFQWLRDSGGLNAELTENRVRLLLENGESAFARIIARRLPEERQRPLLAWADLIERPQPALEAHIANLQSGTEMSGIEVQMVLDGWSRLTRDRPSAALVLHEPLIEHGVFDEATASAYSLMLALGLAWDRRPEARLYFERVADADMDDYALGWQSRVALWNDDWELARTAIAAMSAEQSDSSEWRYWAARASADDDERDRLYESVLPRDNYFAALAAAEMHDRPETHPVTHTRDTAAIAAIRAMPAIVRAAELWRAELPVAATREWQFASQSMSPARRTQAVHVARDLGWLDLAIAAATEQGIFFDYELLYPRPYAAAVQAAADEFDLDPSLIYAVMRQESLYRADAESPAGARGLMQVRRGTAADIASGLENFGPGPIDLLDPSTNIRLGAARLRLMLDRYDDHVVLALAAYNAGPAAADRWLPDRPMASDVWLANVPYNETREYVRRVLWHTVVFESLENRRVNVRHWLQNVEPR